ncbi:MAG TPA: M14 family zinc carboxypeptidase, partial [Acidobacteriota bacterium]|nr:M14 family zinc carboxypeptidase [Acidobacteriota bacterium]
MNRITPCGLCLMIILALALPVRADRAQAAVPLSFDNYYTYEEAGRALEALHQAYPKLPRLDVAGHSDEGRAIWCLTVNNPATGAELE